MHVFFFSSFSFAVLCFFRSTHDSSYQAWQLYIVYIYIYIYKHTYLQTLRLTSVRRVPYRDVQADDGMSLRLGWQRGGRALFQLPESHKDQAAHMPPSRSSGSDDARQPLWG